MGKNLRTLFMLISVIDIVSLMNVLLPKHHKKNAFVERKNCTLQEMAYVMLNSKKISKRLWVEVINMAYHTVKHVYLRLGTKMTLYGIWKGKKLNVGYFHVFGSTCYILNDCEHLGKFNCKIYLGVLLGYSSISCF